MTFCALQGGGAALASRETAFEYQVGNAIAWEVYGAGGHDPRLSTVAAKEPLWNFAAVELGGMLAKLPADLGCSERVERKMALLCELGVAMSDDPVVSSPLRLRDDVAAQSSDAVAADLLELERFVSVEVGFAAMYLQQSIRGMFRLVKVRCVAQVGASVRPGLTRVRARGEGPAQLRSALTSLWTSKHVHRALSCRKLTSAERLRS